MAKLMVVVKFTVLGGKKADYVSDDLENKVAKACQVKVLVVLQVKMHPRQAQFRNVFHYFNINIYI